MASCYIAIHLVIEPRCVLRRYLQVIHKLASWLSSPMSHNIGVNMRLLKLPGCSCYNRKGCTVHPRDTDVAQEPESSYMPYPHGSIMSALISCGLVAIVIINITSPSVPTTPFQAFPFKTNNRRCRRLLLGSEIDVL